MFPWIWWWAPNIHLPWSGDVAQRIEPDTEWFFGAIPPQAGNGRIEKRAFELASYGRQLGLITEVLLGLCEQQAPADAKAQASLEALRGIAARIEAIKHTERAAEEQRLLDELRALRTTHPETFARLRAALDAPAA